MPEIVHPYRIEQDPGGPSVVTIGYPLQGERPAGYAAVTWPTGKPDETRRTLHKLRRDAVKAALSRRA